MKRIIVVEDNKDINRLISYNLNQSGFTVQSVYDGMAAWQKLQEEDFDIVILDIMLPFVDGLDICKMIKEKKSAFKTFVVIVSAKAEPADKIYAHLLGADMYVTKPFSIRQLIEIVSDLTALQDREFSVQRKGVYPQLN